MRKLLALLALLTPGIAHAQTTLTAQQVSGLGAASTPLAGSESIFLVQNGVPVQTPVSSIGGGGGAVSSVSNSDSSLTISPTTGAVIGSINLVHSNTWIATQTFSGGMVGTVTGHSTLDLPLAGGTMTGLLTTDGISDSSTAGINTSSLTNGYKINNTSVLLVPNFTLSGNSQQDLYVGPGAGNPASSTANLNLFVGYNSGQSVTTGGESVCLGTITCEFVTTGGFLTAVGEHAGGYWTTESFSTALGNDDQRDWVSSGGSDTSVGKSAMRNGGGSNDTSIGFSALNGNSSLLTFGGTATNGDTLTDTFTGTFTGSPHAVSIAITTGETPAQMASAFIAAFNTDSVMSLTSAQATASGAIVSFSWPGASTTGLAITQATSGTTTETMTTGAGMLGNYNFAGGFQAMLTTYSGTTASHDIMIGTLAGANLTSGSGLTCITDSGCENISNPTDITIGGYEALATATTAYNIAGWGSNVLQDCTTCSSIAAVGTQVLLDCTTCTGMAMVGQQVGAAMVADSKDTVMGSLAVHAASGTSTLAVFGYECLASATSLGPGNSVFGSCDTSDAFALSGSHNTMLGANAQVPSGSGNNQLSIMNAIYATGASGTLTTTSSAEVGIDIQAPTAAFTVGDAGGATLGPHIAFVNTTAPTITAGTATLDATASDTAGTVTEGNAQTGFTLTFEQQFATSPHCLVTSPSGLSVTSYTPSSTTLIVVNATTSGTTSTVTYACFQ